MKLRAVWAGVKTGRPGAGRPGSRRERGGPASHLCCEGFRRCRGQRKSFEEGDAVALQMLRGCFSQVCGRARESMKGLVGNGRR